MSRQLYDAVGEYHYDHDAQRLANIQSLLARGARPDGKTIFLALSYKMDNVVDLFLKKPIDVNAPIQANGEIQLLFTLNNLEGERRQRPAIPIASRP